MKLLQTTTGWIAIRKPDLDRHNGIKHQYNEIGDLTDLDLHYSLSIRVTR